MFEIGAKDWPGLSKLIEEAGEVQQVCGKLIGSQGKVDHWDGTNLLVRLKEEIADVMAACEFVIEANELDAEGIWIRSQEKVQRFREWHRNQTKVG